MKNIHETNEEIDLFNLHQNQNFPQDTLQLLIPESIIPPNNIKNQINTCELQNNNLNNIMNLIEIPQDESNLDDYEKKTSFMSKPDEKIINKSKSHTNSRNHWTNDENQQLMNLIKQYGAKKWNKIASILKTKSGKQCRDHYMNVLNPDIKNTLWTVEEEKILIQKYQTLGAHWSKIKNFLPGRTTGMIKNYIQMLIKRKGNEFLKDPQITNSDPNTHNSLSENENSSDFESKETEPQNNEFSIHDISFLLNRK